MTTPQLPYLAEERNDADPVIRSSALLAAPTTPPSEPTAFWLELPGFYLRITPPSLFANDTLNEYGQIYSDYPVNA